jgi:hypothetical protein
MNRYETIFLPAAFACLLATFATSCLSGALILAQTFIPGLKTGMFYYEILRIGFWSVLFPLAGMLLLAPLALAPAFARESQSTAVEPAAGEKTELQLLETA